MLKLISKKRKSSVQKHLGEWGGKALKDGGGGWEDYTIQTIVCSDE